MIGSELNVFEPVNTFKTSGHGRLLPSDNIFLKERNDTKLKRLRIIFKGIVSKPLHFTKSKIYT